MSKPAEPVRIWFMLLWVAGTMVAACADAILPAWELSVLHCLTTIPLLTSEARTGLTLNRVLTTEKRYDGFLSSTNDGLTEKMVWARSSASL
jgi:hypothetical protein